MNDRYAVHDEIVRLTQSVAHNSEIRRANVIEVVDNILSVGVVARFEPDAALVYEAMGQVR
jgi:hypothetical protein